MIRSKTFFGLLLCSLLLLLSGCLGEQKEETTVGPTPAPSPLDDHSPKEVPEQSGIPTDEQLFAVIQSNAEAFSQNDLAGYMETIHSQSPNYDVTETDVRALFQTYKFNVEVFDLQVVEKNERQAVIAFTQKTTKLEGPDYQNNESTGTHTLKPDNGKWKITATVVDSTVYLDQNGQRIEEGTEAGGNANYQYRDTMESLQFYVDDRNWQEVFYEENQNEAIAEFLLASETVDNWTELFTIHYFKDSNALVGVDNFLANFEQIMAQSVTGDFSFQVVENTGNDAIYEFALANDAAEPDQHEVARVFAYGDDLFVLRYTSIGPMMEEQYRIEWINRLNQAFVLTDIL